MPATLKQSKIAKLLGTDIALDGDGNFSTTFRSGFYDLALISGPENLEQALLSRLRADAKKLASRLPGSLPAHSTYGVGILSMVSAPYTEVLRQAQTSIVSNFSAEPRINPISASDVEFSWNSSTRILDIKISYTVIGSEVQSNLIFPIYIS
jgi:hypothetical protein